MTSREILGILLRNYACSQHISYAENAFLDKEKYMTTLTFDALQFIQCLRKAGINENETEAIAEAVRDVQVNANLATKYDIALLQQSIKRDMVIPQQNLAVTESKLEVKIAETTADLIRWVVGVGMLQTAMIAAMLLKLIPL